jgi:spectinomycin phosphotransferase
MIEQNTGHMDETEMLQKPDLPDENIASCLLDRYALNVTAITFLALGADADTAVYRVSADDSAAYFLKLRRYSAFAESTVEVPQILHDQGIAPVIIPVATATGQLWTPLEEFVAILYPYIAGCDGFESPLSEAQWVELGAALKGIHTASLPPEASRHIPREEYSSRWRDRVRELQQWAMKTAVTEHATAPLTTFLRMWHDIISDLVERAELLGAALREQRPACVLCHADLHAFNVLISDDGRLYIVDWDTTIFAPRERDLMFMGGGIGRVWNMDREVEPFYRGYGPTEVDQTALAYYRYERIVEDIAVGCDEFLLSTTGEAARAEALALLQSQFATNGVVDIAYQTERLHERDGDGVVHAAVQHHAG